MRAVSPSFIGCNLALADARIVIYGIPFEGRVNLRKGADAGPLDVRLRARPRHGRRAAGARLPGRDPHRRARGVPPQTAALLPDVPNAARASDRGRAAPPARAPALSALRHN